MAKTEFQYWKVKKGGYVTPTVPFQKFQTQNLAEEIGKNWYHISKSRNWSVIGPGMNWTSNLELTNSE